MTNHHPWKSIVSQPLPSSFSAINHGVIPDIGSARSKGLAPPPPPPRMNESVPQQPSAYFPTNYPNISYGPPSNHGNNYYFPPSVSSTSNFTQIAMDESRSAFNSIESMIRTFHSVSNMFESTLANIYTSFRTMTDLFDHFTRLRADLSTLYPLMLLSRFVKFLYHRLLKRLHLRKGDELEDSWIMIYDNLQQTSESMKTRRGQSSGLLVALFFIVSFGTPMLMLRVLNSVIKKRQMNNNNWLQDESQQARVVALYDYVARNADELSFTRGTTIYLAPSTFQSTKSYWFLGTIDHIHVGLIPASYVQPVCSAPQSDVSKDVSAVQSAVTGEGPVLLF